MGDTWLLDKEMFLPVIQCPVCLIIPRDVPIPQCEGGHIVCKPCSVNMTKCPTCSKDLNKKITSSLAASLVELVPHQCKFSKFGCEVNDLLSPLANHEKVCNVRSIKCPRNICSFVPVKDYDNHVNENKCFPVSDPNGVENILYKGIQEIDGASKFNMKQFDITVNFGRFYMYKFYGKNFYVMETYILHQKVFCYCVMMAVINGEDVQGFSSFMTVASKSGKYKIAFTLPVLPIDEVFPLNFNRMVENKSIFFIPLCMMKQFLDHEKIEDGDQKIERVFYTLKVDVKKDLL